MFNRTAFENSRPDGIGVLEIVEQDSSQKSATQFVPLVRTSLNGEIVGPLASLRLAQTYRFTKEQCALVVEALYRFPLPGDAAVTQVEVRFGEVTIAATLKERDKAEAEYRQAKEQGHQAVLAFRESPDVFTLQIAGIAPDEDVVVETSYVQLARPEGLGWSIRIPLTTAPRYLRSDELTSRHAQGQPLALLRDPGHRFALDVHIRKAGAVESSTHVLSTFPSSDGLRVTLRDGTVLPDRDCVLAWQNQGDDNRPGLQVVLHHDRDAHRVYFLGLVTPPADPAYKPSIPREVILLVDHSGSMEGPKWEAADWTVKKFLSDLGPEDKFNLGLFHNTTRWFAKDLKQANPKEIESAIEFLQANRDTGGTELGVALEQALALHRSPGDHARHVLLITDAQVTDEGRILRLADQETERRDRRRINVLCIDAAPNSFLANALAERGGGVAHFLTSSPDEEDITTALDQILAAWGQPAAINLRLTVNRPGVEVAGPIGRVSTEGKASVVDIGDLPRGLAVWVAGRVTSDVAQGLALRLEAGEQEELASWQVDREPSSDLPGLKALFGARRILGLEFLVSASYGEQELTEHLKLLGYSPDRWLTAKNSSPKVYAENERTATQARLRQLLVQESLDYRVPSSETAFVAVRKEKGIPVQGTVLVANALPSGWSGHFLTGAVSSMPLPAPGASKHSGLFQQAADIARPFLTPPSAGQHSVAHQAPAEPAPQRKPVKVFSGTPSFIQNKAVLFDTSRPEDHKKWGERTNLTELSLRFPNGTPKLSDLDRDLILLVYVGDLASPAAKVKIADWVRQGLKRPLHLSKSKDQIMQLVLADPKGAWASQPPTIEIEVGVG